MMWVISVPILVFLGLFVLDLGPTLPRTQLSRSKGQRSRSPGRFAHRHVGASGGCSGGRGNVLAVGNCCYVAVCSTAQGASASTGGGEGRGHIVAAARLQLVIIIIIIIRPTHQVQHTEEKHLHNTR